MKNTTCIHAHIALEILESNRPLAGDGNPMSTTIDLPVIPITSQRQLRKFFDGLFRGECPVISRNCTGALILDGPAIVESMRHVMELTDAKAFVEQQLQRQVQRVLSYWAERRRRRGKKAKSMSRQRHG